MKNTFQDRVARLVHDAGGQSALARRSGLSPGAIQRYLKGGEPTRGALVRLAESCGVSLGWLVYGEETGNPSLPQNRRDIPVYGFAECGLQGWFNEVRYRITTAMEWPDPDLYAVIAAGHSMAPEGIHPGFICMVSPNARAQRGDAVLIRRHDGASTIKLYRREDKDWVYVEGWLEPETPGGPQLAYTDQIRRDSIAALSPVVMVKRRA